MKKFVLLFCLVAVMVSCGTTKIERQAQRTFKGDWTLTSITYPQNSGFVDVTLFGDGSANCFRNSEWHFISNNNKGSYQMTKNECAAGQRNFRWNVQETSPDSGIFEFTLKPVMDGQNARKVNTGYRLNLVSLNQTQMVWEQKVSYNGKPFVIRMNFSKN